MEIREQTSGDVIVIQFEGELMGGEESQTFQDRIYEYIQQEKVNIVIDMAGVKWMNSSGLGMLMGALTTLRSSGGDLKLVHVSDRVRRPIEVTKLDAVIKMYDSVNAAVEDFTEGG